MKTSSYITFLFLTLATGLCLAEDVPRYVQASRVPLRSTPSAASTAQGYVTTNTQVRLLADKVEWCEVLDLESQVRGFCLCKYLAAKPLTMAEIQSHLIGTETSKISDRERLDWLSRAFWVKPSLTKWIAVGTAMESVLLSAETRQKEITGQKALRFKVPEFEAMKKRLAQGVVSKELVDLSSGIAVDNIEYLKIARAKMKLPKVAPSLFKTGDVFAMVGPPFSANDLYIGISLVERLSLTANLPYRVAATEPAQYADFNPQLGTLSFQTVKGEHNQKRRSGFLQVSGAFDIIVGVWDVSQVTVTFDKVPKLQGITRKGEPTEAGVESVTMPIGEQGGGCGGNGMSVKTREISEKGKAPWSSALMSWVGSPAVKGKSTVRTRKFKGADEWDALVIDDIDLDGDGTAEFSVWNGKYQPQISAQGIWQAVFANVSGNWVVVSYNQDADCT